MDQYEFVRTAHRNYGKNISELARMTGHSRNTVSTARPLLKARSELRGIRPIYD